MEAIDLLQRLHSKGLAFRVREDQLLVYPIALLTDELAEVIREHKPLLLAFLSNTRKVTDALLGAAMEVCDRWGDGDAARAAMRADCLATMPALRGDLLAHFQSGLDRDACPDVASPVHAASDLLFALAHPDGASTGFDPFTGPPGGVGRTGNSDPALSLFTSFT